MALLIKWQLVQRSFIGGVVFGVMLSEERCEIVGVSWTFCVVCQDGITQTLLLRNAKSWVV